MLRIAGQTAGPIGLNFVVDTHEWPGGCFKLNKSKFFQTLKKYFFNIFFYPTGNAGLFT